MGVFDLTKRKATVQVKTRTATLGEQAKCRGNFAAVSNTVLPASEHVSLTRSVAAAASEPIGRPLRHRLPPIPA